MKQALILAAALTIVLTCHSKARYTGPDEMIRICDCIVVATIERVDPAEQKIGSFTYRQKATAMVEQCLKGNVSGTIYIYGGENFICAQNHYQPGHYLLFLCKRENYLTGANWHLGMRPITGDRVEWFQDGDDIFASTNRPMNQVIEEIKQQAAP